MKTLTELINSPKKICAGIMTGTSVDAVDVAIVKISGSGVNTHLNLLGFTEYPIDDEIRKLIIKNSYKNSSNVDDICKLNFILPQLYDRALRECCSSAGISIEELDLIGSHGQTIRHLPAKNYVAGFNAASTLQIGDPSVLAKLTGVITVGNFRTGDVALGGEGAPLVPYFEYLMYHSNSSNRLLLNIGGIANFTFLKAGGDINDTLAFDVGPGNMLIDFLMEKFFGAKYDVNGATANKGKFNSRLFEALKNKDDFLFRNPPKSAGRENYGKEFLIDLLREFKTLPPEDWVNTVAYYTAFAVFANYKKFILPLSRVDELIVSGGGANNGFIFKKLQELFYPVRVKRLENETISAESKEAICFAVLANEAIAGNPANIPNVTGAKRPTILGEICLP